MLNIDLRIARTQSNKVETNLGHKHTSTYGN